MALRCFCVVYISEARSREVIQALYEAVGVEISSAHFATSLASPQSSDETPFIQPKYPYRYTKQSSLLVHSFLDPVYNRSSFYLACYKDGTSINETIHLCNRAYDLLDFSKHCGLHPSLGTVDHVSFSPIDGTVEALNDTKKIADIFCKRLFQLQTTLIYSYGHLSQSNIRLRDLRRSLHYFKANGKMLLEKDIRDVCNGQKHPSDLPTPSYGEHELDYCYHPKRGLMCVGVVPYVQNFNMCIGPVLGVSRSINPAEWKPGVVQITKTLRSPDVEALTLPHSDGSLEIACNLLNTLMGSTPMDLKKRCEMLIDTWNKESGKDFQIGLRSSYTTNPSLQELINRCSQLHRNYAFESQRDVKSDDI